MSNTGILTANLRVLKARFPSVYQRLIDTGSQPTKYFEYTGNGESLKLISKGSGQPYAVYGEGKRGELLDRWMQGLELAQESLYAISGFGDGSHVQYFLDHSSKGTYFLVAEEDPALLRETLSRFDYSALLANERFLLGVGETDDHFFRDLQAAAVSEIQEVNMVVFSPLHSMNEGYYDQMRNELVRQYLVVRPMMEVNLRTATTIQGNTFENMPIMASSPDVAEIGNQMTDIPFVLVGAGPSLDESIDFLKTIQHRAIIVCSNSPLRKLINNGIRPHLVVTADPQSPTFEGFRGVDVEGLTLACPFSAYPEIVQLFNGRILSWCTFNPIVDLVKKYMGKSPGSPIMEKGTVSGCVLDLSRLLGSKKVLFVGQDLCIRDDGRYYTDDSAYSDYGGHYSGIKQGHRLPGNSQPQVLVEARLFVYLKTFEQFISEQSGVEYRNLARTGVKVKGAPYMTYEEALNWIGEGSSKPFGEKIESLLQNQVSAPSMKEIFKGCRDHVQKIFEKSLHAALNTENLPEKFSATHYSENKAVLELLRAGRDINQIIDREKDYWMVLFEGKTKGEVIRYRRKARDIEFANQNWGAIQRNKEYFWAISEGCNWLLNEMNLRIFNRKEDTCSSTGKLPVA